MQLSRSILVIKAILHVRTVIVSQLSRSFASEAILNAPLLDVEAEVVDGVPVTTAWKTKAPSTLEALHFRITTCFAAFFSALVCSYPCVIAIFRAPLSEVMY
jgi:hypothetical protein